MTYVQRLVANFIFAEEYLKMTPPVCNGSAIITISLLLILNDFQVELVTICMEISMLHEHYVDKK